MLDFPHWIDFLIRAPTGFGSRIRIAWMRACGAKIGRPCRFEPIRYRYPDEIQTGHHVAICRGTVLYPHLGRAGKRRIIIGNHVFINFYCFIDAGERVEIGNNVLIGPYVYITDGDHGMDPSSMRITQPMSLAPVIIEDGVWIGARASILKGVKIGRNAVIGAGAVVTRSVEENDVAAGVPAKSIRKTHN